MTISKRHLLVIDEYFKPGPNRFNQTEAYLKVYPKAKYESAANRATALFKKVQVKQEVERRFSELQLSVEESMSILQGMAKGDMADFLVINERWSRHPTEHEKIIGERQIETGDGDKKKTITEYQVTNVVLDPYKIVDRRFSHLIKTYTNSPRNGVRLDLYDKQAAIDKTLKVQGAYKDSEKIIEVENKPVVIPADSIGPAFFNAYRDVKYNKHLEYLLYGGRGSLKSSFVSLAIIELLVNHPQVHALAARQVGDTLRNSVYDQLRWAINELGLERKFKATVSPLEIEYIPTGQKIYFRGGDDPVKIKSIKPPFGYIGILWLEELDQFRGPEAVRSIEQSTIRGGDTAWIFKSFNPPRTKANWANKYTQIPKENQFKHFSNYQDAPAEWLGKPWLDEAKFLKEINPAAYEHEYGGIANGTGGLVFENVQIRPITDDEIAEFDRILMGLDWGYYPDPYLWGKMHHDAARMILYIFDEYHCYKQSNQQTYNYLKKEKGLTGDDLIIADSAEPKSIADYREYGANIRGAEKGPDSVSYSMKWLQSLKAIIIDDRRAPYHAEEFLNYELEQDKNGEFISAYPDRNNHAIDDVRYATNLIWRVRGQ